MSTLASRRPSPRLPSPPVLPRGQRRRRRHRRHRGAPPSSFWTSSSRRISKCKPPVPILCVHPTSKSVLAHTNSVRPDPMPARRRTRWPTPCSRRGTFCEGARHGCSRNIGVALTAPTWWSRMAPTKLWTDVVGQGRRQHPGAHRGDAHDVRRPRLLNSVLSSYSCTRIGLPNVLDPTHALPEDKDCVHYGTHSVGMRRICTWREGLGCRHDCSHAQFLHEDHQQGSIAWNACAASARRKKKREGPRLSPSPVGIACSTPRAPRSARPCSRTSAHRS